MFEGLEKRVNERGIVSYWEKDEIIYKQCTKCKEIKNAKMFGNDKNRKDGKSSRCRECRSEYQKSNRENIREYERKYRQKWDDKKRENLKEYKQKYYKTNKEEILLKCKIYRTTHKEEEKERHTRWCKENAEYIRSWKKENYKKNKKEIRKKQKQRYEKEKQENIKNLSDILKQTVPLFEQVNLPIYGYVYKFENIKTGHIYIGQTIQPIVRRYRAEIIKGWIKERKEKQNQKFVEELESESDFIFEIIAYGVCQYHLDKLEMYFINKYNSCENGYNNYPGNHKSKDGLNEFNEILKENNLEFVDGELRRVCDEK